MPDIENKCIKDWLNASFDAHKKIGHMLTLREFIHHTKFKINENTMDKFYYNLDNDTPIYIDKLTIDWFGYTGSDTENKKLVKAFLNKFYKYKNIYWFEYNNDAYISFYTEFSSGDMTPDENKVNKVKIYPNPLELKNNYNTTHLIVHPVLFKYIVLMSESKKAMEIKDYYITLEELIKKYNKYQLESIKIDKMLLTQSLKESNKIIQDDRKNYEVRANIMIKSINESKVEIDIKTADILEIKTDLNNVTNDRALTDGITPPKHDALVIVKHNIINIIEGIITIKINYVSIRGQITYINTKLRELRRKYPVLEEIINLNTPNAITAWISVCKSHVLTGNIQKLKGMSFLLIGINDNELKERIEHIDEMKRKNSRYIQSD